MSDHPWVSVKWDAIEPGDVVRAPDGSEYHVTAKIDMPGDDVLSFLRAPIVPGFDGEPDASDQEGWSERPRGSTCEAAWRFNHHSARPGAEAFAVGRLRLAGFDVETLQS